MTRDEQIIRAALKDQHLLTALSLEINALQEDAKERVLRYSVDGSFHEAVVASGEHKGLVALMDRLSSILGAD